jgi:hypothetical protein
MLMSGRHSPADSCPCRRSIWRLSASGWAPALRVGKGHVRQHRLHLRASVTTKNSGRHRLSCGRPSDQQDRPPSGRPATPPACRAPPQEPLLRGAAALARLPDDSPTLLQGELSGRKLLAWCGSLPLAQVEAVGKAMQGPVNDVLLACVSGAVGRHLPARGDDPAGKKIRTMVPLAAS